MRHGRSTSIARLLPLALIVGCGTQAPVVDVLPLADTVDTVGPYQVTVVVADSDRVTDARVLWFPNDDAAPRLAALVRQDKTDRWMAGLPGQPVGSRVSWRVEVETDEGDLVRVPAPTEDDLSPAWTFNVVTAD